MKKFDVVTFHSPLPDEDATARYLLLDEPDLSKPRVNIEYLGKIIDGALVPTSMTFRPISTVALADLIPDPTLEYIAHGATSFEIRSR